MSLKIGETEADKVKTAAANNRYCSLQVKFLQAENVYNKYLLIFTNKIMDNVKDYKNPTAEEMRSALEIARAEFEQMQEALEAEKAYREVKMELEKENGKRIEELKPYFID